MLLAETPSFQVEHEDILQARRVRNARAARSMTDAHLEPAISNVMRLIGGRLKPTRGRGATRYARQGATGCAPQ